MCQIVIIPVTSIRGVCVWIDVGFSDIAYIGLLPNKHEKDWMIYYVIYTWLPWPFFGTFMTMFKNPVNAEFKPGLTRSR